jgi:hypothetical protein
LDKKDYFFEKNFKTARTLIKNKTKCKKCNLYLCVCQSELKDFDTTIEIKKKGFCEYCKMPRILNKNGFCCEGHEKHYKTEL